MADETPGFGGLVLRFAFALLLVLLTFNPTGRSYYHWLAAGLPAVDAPKALAGIALLIGYPAKALTNPVFALKFACLIGAAVLVRAMAGRLFPLDEQGMAVSFINSIFSGFGSGLAKFFGFLALVMASVNIFGGFLVTQRMLAMYKKKEKK